MVIDKIVIDKIKVKSLHVLYIIKSVNSAFPVTNKMVLNFMTSSM